MAQAPAVLDRVRQTFLTPIERDLQSALPANVDPKRFQAAFITAVQTNPEIMRCTPESVRNALMKCAADGLVPDGRMAAIVPYKSGTDTNAQYMPMVQGIISRARDLGDSFSITAECVYEKDELIVNRADPNITQHNTPPLGQPRGDIVGAYAIFRDKEGRVIHREIMDRIEIDTTRGASRSKNSPAWNNWFGEMTRKTVIRRGAKYIPMSDALRKIIEREDENAILDLPAERVRDATYNPLVAEPTNARVESDQPIPAHVFSSYADKLREAKTASDLPALATEFWAVLGGWPPKRDSDLALGQRIYNAVVNHFDAATTKVVLDRELQGILKG